MIHWVICNDWRFIMMATWIFSGSILTAPTAHHPSTNTTWHMPIQSNTLSNLGRNLKCRILSGDKMYLWNVLMITYFFEHAQICLAAINKRNLCYEYKVQGSRWNKDIISVLQTSLESACLTQCGHQPRCMAYNWFPEVGTCELLPALDACDETEEQEGSIFVHLRDCNNIIPWEVGRRNWSAEAPCLYWRRFQSSQDCPSDILRNKRGKFCVALVPHKGIYVPGWYSHEYRMVTEEAESVKCSGTQYGYLLQVAGGCPTAWKNFKVGDPIPTQAVQVSTWMDGTPLYMVDHDPNFGLGYYFPPLQQTFIMMVTTKSPVDVLMLVYI